MLSRRQFLKGSASVVSAGMLVPSLFGRALQESANAASFGTPTADRTLVIVQLSGGNDGLNTVIPYRDPRYREYRHDIAIPAGTELPLDSRLALHPSLPWFQQQWTAGRLAIVEAVGYPSASRSHFESTAIWQTADTGAMAEGWLGRALQGSSQDVPAISIGRQTAGEVVASGLAAPSFSSIDQYQIATGPNRYNPASALITMYDQYPPSAPYAALLDETMQEVYRSTRSLQQVHAAYTPMATYPQNSFASGLRVLAEAINANLGLRVGHVSLGGFDTHDSEVLGQAPLLATLNNGLEAFFADLAAHGRGDNVVVMIWTEFGRRVKENGSGGTDHGKANALYLLGTPIAGGRTYGDPVDLNVLDDGDLKFHTDFRSVYATLLNDWLGVEPKPLLGASFPLLGFVR